MALRRYQAARQDAIIGQYISLIRHHAFVRSPPFASLRCRSMPAAKHSSLRDAAGSIFSPRRRCLLRFFILSAGDALALYFCHATFFFFLFMLPRFIVLCRPFSCRLPRGLIYYFIRWVRLHIIFVICHCHTSFLFFARRHACARLQAISPPSTTKKRGGGQPSLRLRRQQRHYQSYPLLFLQAPPRRLLFASSLSVFSPLHV